MKKFHKVLAVCVVVVLIICCCCFTVSAATTESPINDAVVIEEGTGTKFHLHVVDGKDDYWSRGVYIPDSLSGTMYLCTNANISLNHSNVFKWNSFTFSLWNVASGSSSISDVSLVLLDENYNVLTTLYERAYANTDFWQEHFSIPSGSYTNNSAIDVKYIALTFDFSMRYNATLYYYFNGYSFGYSVIDKATAEQEKTNELLGDITADKYEPPSGQTDIDEHNKLEQEALDSTEQGRDEASKLFNDFDIGFFRDGFNAVVVLYNRIIPKWIWLDKLLVFSLSVGIFALLVGLAQSAIGPLSGYERKNWQKGAARQDAVRTKKDGIASHRPSRK